MADEQVADIPVASPSTRFEGGRRLLRLFLMVAGGLAAPCLALAAFFLSGGDGAGTSSRPTAAQSGLVSGTAGPGQTPAAPAVSTTTTTAAQAAPAAPAGPLRDPFAPLVTQSAPSG